GGGGQGGGWVGRAGLGEVVEGAVEREDWTSPVNVVAPAPARSRDFARTLGRVLRRPAVLPAPAPALRLVFGEMADEALLSSACVSPKRLTSLGYRFAFEDLERALRSALQG